MIREVAGSLGFSLLLSMLIMLTFLPVAVSQTWTERVRPLAGGVQIQNGRLGGLGSLGFMAYYEYTEFGITWRVYGFVTASHFANLTDPVYQPSIATNNYVGYVYLDPPFPRRTDSLFVYIQTVRKGTPPDPDLIAPHVLVAPNTREEVYGHKSRPNMYVGEPVCKVGRSTGRTCGNIVGFGNDPIRAGDVIINYYVYADYDSSGGDSGGTVYRMIATKPDYPAHLYVYGIHFGRVGNRRVFCPTDGIIDDLGVQVYTVYSGY